MEKCDRVTHSTQIVFQSFPNLKCATLSQARQYRANGKASLKDQELTVEPVFTLWMAGVITDRLICNANVQFRMHMPLTGCKSPAHRINDINTIFLSIPHKLIYKCI